MCIKNSPPPKKKSGRLNYILATIRKSCIQKNFQSLKKKYHKKSHNIHPKTDVFHHIHEGPQLGLGIS